MLPALGLQGHPVARHRRHGPLLRAQLGDPALMGQGLAMRLGRQLIALLQRLLAAQLLALQPLVQLGVFLFQRDKALELVAMRRAHQVREHVHLAEGLLALLGAGDLVRHQRPVGAGDVALRPGLPPCGVQARFALHRAEGAHSARVTLVERLVQRLGNVAVQAGLADRQMMDFEVAQALDHHVPAHQLAQLARAQAGADDRAMQVAFHLVKPGAADGGRSHRFGRRVVPAASPRLVGGRVRRHGCKAGAALERGRQYGRVSSIGGAVS